MLARAGKDRAVREGVGCASAAREAFESCRVSESTGGKEYLAEATLAKGDARERRGQQRLGCTRPLVSEVRKQVEHSSRALFAQDVALPR